MNVLRLALLLGATTVVLAACGEDAGSGGSASSGSKRGALATLNRAVERYDRAADAFASRPADCRVDAGSGGRVELPGRGSVDCQLEQSRAMVEGVGAVSDAVQSLEGDYADECRGELRSLSTFLDELQARWQQVHDDWRSYAEGDDVSHDRISAHIIAAVEDGHRFADKEYPDMARACFTPEERRRLVLPPIPPAPGREDPRPDASDRAAAARPADTNTAAMG